MKIDYKNPLKAFKINTLLSLTIIIGTNCSYQKETNDSINLGNSKETKKESINKKSTLKYEVLREWNPYQNINAIGMDILIDEKDATKEKIIELIREIVNEETELANILIFTSKNAWQEGQRGSGFTDDYKKNYIAFYIKNYSNDRAYSGFNEIRWMQEIGTLSSLYGTTTQL